MKVFKNIFVMCCVLMFAQIGFAAEKIGVVDIQSIVSKSNAVQNLKHEHEAQLESLNAIISEAQTAIANENDPQKIVMLQDKYNNEFNTRKNIIDSQYQLKLSTIENSIKQDIINCAQKHNYDFVVAKSMVFYGGDDITEIVEKEVR